MTHSPLPQEELDLFKQLKGLETIFDVGARIDTDYIELKPEAEHHLFEPNPEFFRVLQIKAQNRPNIFLNKFGLGDREETRGYYSPLQTFVGTGDAPEDLKADYMLPIITLGKYVTDNNIEKIDFLKIDTEGHDLKVLIGAYNWFKMIKFIQYEHWGEHNNKMTIGLLQDDFEIHNVGYRNMFCMNRNLVSEEERNRLKAYINDNKLGELV